MIILKTSTWNEPHLRIQRLLLNHRSNTFSRSSDMTNALKVYCEESSIHGISYLANRKLHFIEKILWDTAVIVSFICCGLLIFKIGAKFNEDMMVIYTSDTAIPVTNVRFNAIGLTFKTLSLYSFSSQIPFAAVTYCPDLYSHNRDFDYNRITRLLRERKVSIESVSVQRFVNNSSSSHSKYSCYCVFQFKVEVHSSDRTSNRRRVSLALQSNNRY
jgi:hypothetical protein